MKINRILFIDDSVENGATAITTDPRIDFVSSPEGVEAALKDYDCIITDLRMTHAESGFEVVEKALRAGKLPYIATGGTYEHGGSFNRVSVFNYGFFRNFDKMTKAEPRFWQEALQAIDGAEAKVQPVRLALEKVYSTLGIVPEDTLKMMMQMYRQNRDKITGGKH